MEHKGYVGIVEFDPTIDAFHGDVVNTTDTITFEGRSVDEIREAFRASVEDYLEMCRDLGRKPDRPYSGTFSLRLGPELHRAAALEAARRKLSLNVFVARVLSERLAGPQEGAADRRGAGR